MRAPAFWWRQKPTFEANLLRPLGALYGAVAARRMRQTGERAEVPVVCVGNFTVGGSGKTPAALALANLLAAEGETPVFLSRGYGGRLAGPVRVDSAVHRASAVGDEPLLLARAFPTIVAHDRPAGARLAVEEGASLIIMDDGLQNPSLLKNVAFAVIDGATGFGNGLCLPSGPLRAPVAAQWRHVDAVIIVGDGIPEAGVAHDAAAQNKAVFRARLQPDEVVSGSLDARRVLAFAGIGRPEKFFATLENCGAVISRRKAFPDHHAFTANEIRAIAAEAQAEGLTPVTTEKDLVRIAELADLPSGGREIQALPIRLVFADESAVRDLIVDRIRTEHRRRA